MRKFLAVSAAVLVLSVFSLPAAAGDSFTGVCTLSGTATLSPGIGAVPSTASTFTFATDNSFQGGAGNRCTGAVVSGGVQIPVAATTANAAASASGQGSLVGLGCTVSAAAPSLVGTDVGVGSITVTDINGGTHTVNFTLNIVGTGTQVTLAAVGSGAAPPLGGAAAGQATFAIDPVNSALSCANGSATSLHFFVAVTGVNLN